MGFDLPSEYQRLRKQHDQLRYEYSCLHVDDMVGLAILRARIKHHHQELAAFVQATRRHRFGFDLAGFVEIEKQTKEMIRNLNAA